MGITRYTGSYHEDYEDDISTMPEVKLYKQMIKCAVYDYLRSRNILKNRNSYSKKTKRRALCLHKRCVQFLNTNNKWYRCVCEYAGMDADKVAGVVKKNE